MARVLQPAAPQESHFSELKRALGTTADLTVFRKLKTLDYYALLTPAGLYALRSLLGKTWHQFEENSSHGSLAGHE
jgi:hypothetical protein